MSKGGKASSNKGQRGKGNNPNYPSKTGRPSGPNRGNTRKK